MANLTAAPALTAVPQIETSTPVLGGPGGPLNLQAQALLNQIEYDRQQGALGVSFTAAGTGAVARSVRDELRERVSVKQFGAMGDGITDDTAAFIAAIAAADVIYIPAGTYLVGRIPINKNNFTMRGAGYNRSVLLAKAVNEITLDVACDSSVTGLVLEDFKLQGNATAAGGIRLGSSDLKYCAIPMLNRVAVWDYSRSATTNGFGIQLACVQNVTIHNCWIYRNRHQYQRLQGTGYATSTHITGKSGYIGEGYVGMYIDAEIDDLYVDDVVIEGNENSGIIITGNATLGARGVSLYMDGVYLEDNNATGLGVIHLTGGAGVYQEHLLVLNRCNFAVNAGKYLVLDKTFATVRSTRLLPGDITTTANTTVCFESNRYPNAGDYLAQYRELLGNVTVRDTNAPALATDINQVNMMNAITFPNVARPVTDPYTLDDYREGIWNPELSSDGIAPTYSNNESADGTYTKIGNLVFCRCKLRVNISAIGTGTPRVLGLPFTSKGLEPPAIGLSSALTTVAGTEYIVTGGAVVFNGAAYAITPDGYLVFTVTYQAA